MGRRRDVAASGDPASLWRPSQTRAGPAATLAHGTVGGVEMDDQERIVVDPDADLAFIDPLGIDEEINDSSSD